MYIITNRSMDLKATGFKKFTKHTNTLGPNELTAVAVNGIRKPQVKVLGDALNKAEVVALQKKFKLDIDANVDHFVPLKIACDTFKKARAECKNVVIYIHGYNNDVKDIYKSACELERLYNVIVIPFSWPANGGGALSGTLSYLADKRDARASEDALNRFVDIVGYYFALLTQAARSELTHKAMLAQPDNPTKQRELPSTLAESRKLIFDHVILAAADTNNFDHKQWVESIRARKGVYVLINENDYALSWSRRKPGEEQRARLGHYLRKLDARNAHYIDFTGLKAVTTSHSYFDNKTAGKNAAVKRFFTRVFAAESVLNHLEYQAHNNTYRPK